MDSKVVSLRVDVNPDTMEYNLDEIEKCLPDPEYMKWNPVKATLYHNDPTPARIEQRVSRKLLWHSDKELGEGIEVRQCALWNERFGTHGAWDPTPCVMTETDVNKTSCECSQFGSIAIISEASERYTISGSECSALRFVKYIGIGVSGLVCLAFIVACITSKHVWDMFHCLRMHFFICWIGIISTHFVTDFDSIRDDTHINLLVGMIQAYFYVAAVTWSACEAHGTFKAFTAGIISGRQMVYYPIGYGTPFLPLGILFLFFHDEMGSDPRCFISFELIAKQYYFCYVLLVALVGLVLGITVMFNVAKPQTKRKNLVSDLTSQAWGTFGSTVSMFIFVLAAFYVYVRHPESETIDIYCPFSLGLGYLGIAFFLLLGLLSIRFRTGLSGKMAEQKLMMKYAIAGKTVEDPNDAEGEERSMGSPSETPPDSPVSTRPTTAASHLTVDDEVASESNEEYNDDTSDNENTDNDAAK